MKFLFLFLLGAGILFGQVELESPSVENLKDGVFSPAMRITGVDTSALGDPDVPLAEYELLDFLSADLGNGLEIGSDGGLLVSGGGAPVLFDVATNSFYFDADNSGTFNAPELAWAAEDATNELGSFAGSAGIAIINDNGTPLDLSDDYYEYDAESDGVTDDQVPVVYESRLFIGGATDGTPMDGINDPMGPYLDNDSYIEQDADGPVALWKYDEETATWINVTPPVSSGTVGTLDISTPDNTNDADTFAATPLPVNVDVTGEDEVVKDTAQSVVITETATGFGIETQDRVNKTLIYDPNYNGPAASRERNDLPFANLADAIAATIDGDTIELKDDVQGAVTIDISHEITLDTNHVERFGGIGQFFTIRGDSLVNLTGANTEYAGGLFVQGNASVRADSAAMAFITTQGNSVFHGQVHEVGNDEELNPWSEVGGRILAQGDSKLYITTNGLHLKNYTGGSEGAGFFSMFHATDNAELHVIANNDVIGDSVNGNLLFFTGGVNTRTHLTVNGNMKLTTQVPDSVVSTNGTGFASGGYLRVAVTGTIECHDKIISSTGGSAVITANGGFKALGTRGQDGGSKRSGGAVSDGTSHVTLNGPFFHSYGSGPAGTVLNNSTLEWNIDHTKQFSDGYMTADPADGTDILSSMFAVIGQGGTSGTLIIRGDSYYHSNPTTNPFLHVDLTGAAADFAEVWLEGDGMVTNVPSPLTTGVNGVANIGNATIHWYDANGNTTIEDGEGIKTMPLNDKVQP